MTTEPATSPDPVFELADADSIAHSRAALDAHTVEMMAWHFHPSTGSPFWLEYATSLPFDPLTEINCFDDLKKFPPFEDEWLRGGPVTRWIPQGLAGQPAYVFETGGTTGTPKSRVNIRDFRTDYEEFSATLPGRAFPQRSKLAHARPLGATAIAAVNRAPGPISGRHQFLHRPRPTLGHQVDPEGLDGTPRSLQRALH
jgi:hypothetical protein